MLQYISYLPLCFYGNTKQKKIISRVPYNAWLSAGSDRLMASIKVHRGCNDTRCVTHTRVELPRASVSPDWWKPRCGETDIKSTNLPRKSFDDSLRKGGEQVEEARHFAVSPPFSCPRIDGVHRCIARRMQLVARRANKHCITVVVVLLEGNWCVRMWKGWKRDNAFCSDALGTGCSSRLSLFRDPLAKNKDIYVWAIFPNYVCINA